MPENPGLERIRAQQKDINAATTCEECGSEWFMEGTFQQYQRGAWGTADLNVVSEMPQTVRVCLCGTPAMPNQNGIRGRVATGAMASFQDSMKAAEKSRGKSATMDQVAEVVPSKAEFDGMAARLRDLEALVKKLTEAKGGKGGTDKTPKSTS